MLIVMAKSFNTTAEIPVPKRLIDQIIGQEKAVEIIKKAANQKRNVLLIGEPGTGKSMLAQAMAELLPVEKLQDILILPNLADRNNPKVLVAPSGEGRKILENEKKKSIELEAMSDLKPSTSMLLFISLLFTLSIVAALYLKLFSDIILAAFIIIGGIFLAILIFASAFTTGLKNMRTGGREEETTPKLLVDNSSKTIAPFVDATGAHSGALLGDVRHDPFQSGGLGTPAHLRVEAGMIHKANRGVLFIDEISTLSPKSQQELLSAMQDKKYSITGQSEMSSGAMVRTDPVPCDFLLIASGNLFDLEKMHPALRSRIRGYGYEIYLNEFIDDNAMDRKKLERFVAQEVVKDGKIEHFTKEAVDEIIFEAKRRAGTKGKFTLRLRDLGGLVRAAGDIAKTEHAKIVTREHVMEAKKLARTLEQQVADKQIIQKKEYEVFVTHGYRVGKVNGLAVMGTERGNFGGILLPIEAQVAPALSAREGKIIATGKLGEIAKEAVQNVSAIIKKYKGTDISSYDTHIQFLQTYEGVEGDSASVSVATAVISALEDIPVDLSIAMTGSLSVRGEVLPVGGVSAKIEAAIEAGAKTVIVPAANKGDVVLSPEKLKKIKIIPANNLCDVLSAALKPGKEKDSLIKGISKIVSC
jgi:Lon-like ATP-dependent protease